MDKQKIIEIYRKQKKNGICSVNMLANAVAFACDLDSETAMYQVKSLIENGDLVVDLNSKSLSTPQEMGLVQGVLSKNPKGFGFVSAEGFSEDIFIPAVFMGKALYGDRVLVEIVDDKFNEGKKCGIIRAVTGHTTKNVVGTIEKHSKKLYLVPDEADKYPMIEIQPNFTLDALPNDKVVVKIQSYDDKLPVGEVVEILGDSYDASTQIKAILRSYDLYEQYPTRQVDYAKTIKQQVEPEQIKGRLDLRDQLIFTIDGDDAKDFDDAISLSINEDGTYHLGVHIADVSEYVKPNSILAEEAYERATSNYFPRLVLPMLPTELSNGICSLNPHVDRLTLSAFMDIDKNGKVLHFEMHKSVINSKERMTYKNFQKILNGDKEMCLRYPHLIEIAKNMETLSDILSKSRDRRGELDFDLPETQIILDENNEVIDIQAYPIEKSNQLIESFMVVTNEAVAEFMGEVKIPAIYRVHNIPDPERLASFNRFLGQYGLAIKCAGNDFVEITPKDFQKLLKEIEDKEYGEVVRKVALRSTKKAYYDIEDLGHFALANKHYCHFTSPIRRLPDLIIHTIIKEYLDGSLSNERKKYWEHYTVELARNSSEKERNADEAERTVNDYYKCKYMSKFIGEEFEGKVNGVTADKIYVELPNTVEGAIKIADLPFDNYVLDEDLHRLDGEHMSFKLGDAVKVKVLSANEIAREINFGLVKDFVKDYSTVNMEREPVIRKKVYDTNGEPYFIERRSRDETRKEFYERIGMEDPREQSKNRRQNRGEKKSQKKHSGYKCDYRKYDNGKKKDNEINNHKKRQFQDKSKFLKKNVNKDKDDEMEI